MDLFGRKARLEVDRLQGLVDAALALLNAREQLLAQLTLELAIERERNAEVKDAPSEQPTFRSQPLYMSEDEEDIKFLRDTEQISVAEAEDMLRQLEFDNSEIEFDIPLS